MYLRKRQSNLSIERSIYEPAVKDVQGNISKPAVRSTRYIGSIKTYTRLSDVPAEIIVQLTEDEKSELQKFLAKNEPSPFVWIENTITSLNFAAKELRDCATKLGPEASKKLLEGKIKSADDAWNAFFKAAQDHGLKRKRKSADKSNKTPAALTN